MKFKFSLDPVLKVREHEEKIQKQKLAEKLSEKKKVVNQREKLQEELKSQIENMNRGQTQSLHNLRRYNGYIHSVHKKVNELNGSLKVIENAVKKERDKLAHVHRRRNIMEKLKEEERENFLKEVSRHQRKVMDEVATQTYSQ